LEEARALVNNRRRQPRSEENLEANITLAERLWSNRNAVCKEGEGGDRVVDRVLAQLAR
jgi:hypothetical protein